MRLRRQLAQQRPDAFLPDLAMSLGALGSILKADEPGKAAKQFQEAIRLLSPLFLRLPQAHGRLMTGLLRDYVQAAQQAGLGINEELLGPIMEKLEAIGMMRQAKE